MTFYYFFALDKVQKVQTVDCILDQSQRILQDDRFVEQPRLPEGRPTASRVLSSALIMCHIFSLTLIAISSYKHVFDSTPLRYLVTPSLLKHSEDAFKELSWREMERVPAFPGLTDVNTEPCLYIPGGGITKGLFTDRYIEKKVIHWPYTTVFYF